MTRVEQQRVVVLLVVAAAGVLAHLVGRPSVRRRSKSVWQSTAAGCVREGLSLLVPWVVAIGMICAVADAIEGRSLTRLFWGGAIAAGGLLVGYAVEDAPRSLRRVVEMPLVVAVAMGGIVFIAAVLVESPTASWGFGVAITALILLGVIRQRAAERIKSRPPGSAGQ